MSTPDVTNEPAVAPLDALAGTQAVTHTRALAGGDPDDLPLRDTPAAPPLPLQAIQAEVQRYAKENGLDPAKLARDERTLRQLLQQAGLLPVQGQAGPVGGLALQLQYLIDGASDNPIGRALKAAILQTSYVTLQLASIQVNTKLEFSSVRDYVATTARIDPFRRTFSQVNLEFRGLRFQQHISNSFSLEDVRPIINADALPKKPSTYYSPAAAGVPGTRGGQIGLAWIFNLGRDPKNHATLVLETVGGLDLYLLDPAQSAKLDRQASAPADLWDFSKVVYLGLNGQVTLPITVLVPELLPLFKDLGVRWSVTLKLFGRMYGTKKAWLALGRLLGQGATAVGEAAAAAVGALTAGEAVLVAAALVAAVLTGRGIYRDLKTKNYLPLLTAYAAGYGDQLAEALTQTPDQLSTALAAYGDFPAERIAGEIRAVLRKEDLGELVTGRSGLGSQDVLFAAAVRAAERLGRAALLGAIAEYLSAKDEGLGGWLEVQRRYQNDWLPQLRARGTTFRSRCIEYLTLQIGSRDQDVHDLRVALSALDDVIRLH